MTKGRSRPAQTAANTQPHTDAKDACELFLAELQVHRAMLHDLLQMVNVEVSRHARARVAAGPRPRCKRLAKRTF